MPENNQPLIELTAVNRYFDTEEVRIQALHNINMQINQGDYVAIAGPSGCGKSTLLGILGLLDTPSSGSYRINNHATDGLDSVQRAALRNREIGFIFQAFNLIGDLTVLENVMLPLSYGKIPRAEHKERALAKLEAVHMSHRAQHYPAQLSGGQQQRVAVARSLVIEPSVLLADEPTGNLDSQNAEAIMELLNGLNAKGTTICMVTHDERFADCARKTIHLLDGAIVD